VLSTSPHLLERARLGDPQAFGTLADEHYRTVYGVAFSIVGDWSAAEDIAQETLLLAWTRRTSLRNALAFPSWLRRIAGNLSKNWVRSKDYRRKLAEHYRVLTSPEAPVSASPDRKLDTHERVASVWDALESLPSGLRETIVLYYLHGESLRGVATALGISENAAKKRLHYGRTKLREHFEERWMGEMARARSTMAGHSARDRFLAGIAIGPAVPELAKSAANAGVGLWWETTKQTLSNKVLLGAAAMTAKKLVLSIGIVGILVMVGLYLTTSSSQRPIPPASVTQVAPVNSSTETEPSDTAGTTEPAKQGTATSSLDMETRAGDVPAKVKRGDRRPGDATTPKSAKPAIKPKEIPDPKDYAWVEGIVIDERNAPIPGANVTVAALGLMIPAKDESIEMMTARRAAYAEYLGNREQCWDGMTDASGMFRIEGIRYEGLALVTANVPDHAAAMRSVNITPASASEFVRLQMRSGVTIAGKVLTAENMPVPDASVRLLGYASESDLGGGSIGLAVFTNAEGRFELGVEAPGTMSVAIASPIYGSASFTNVAVSPAEEVVLQFDPVTTVYGRVTDESSQPVADVEVRLTGSVIMESQSGDAGVAPGRDSKAMTGKDGAYEISPIDPGQRYRSAVFGNDGKQLAEGDSLSELEPGQRYELNFVVSPEMTIKGIVRGKGSNRPLPQMTIMAIVERTNAAPGAGNGPPRAEHATSASDGAYSITLSGGACRCAVIPTFSALGFSGGWQNQPDAVIVEIKPGETITQDLVVPEPLSRSFMVIDGAGNPVEGATITMEQRTASGVSGLGVNETTDAKGRVILATLRPEIELQFNFTKADYLIGHSEALVGKPGEILPEETVVMFAETGITGTIVDADGKPLADRSVQITATFGNQEVQATSTAGPDGVFVVTSGLPATEVLLQISANAAQGGTGSVLRADIERVTLTADSTNDVGSVTLSAATP
jgi:RNA polymerase sigma-70 factor (ECF subfamily)